MLYSTNYFKNKAAICVVLQHFSANAKILWTFCSFNTLGIGYNNTKSLTTKKGAVNICSKTNILNLPSQYLFHKQPTTCFRFTNVTDEEKEKHYYEFMLMFCIWNDKTTTAIKTKACGSPRYV